METITFDTMPAKIAEMDRKLDFLMESLRNPTVMDEDRYMTIEELIEYLPEHPAKQTIYQNVNERKMPFEKFGRRLYFKKSIIDKWLANGRRI